MLKSRRALARALAMLGEEADQILDSMPHCIKVMVAHDSAAHLI